MSKSAIDDFPFLSNQDVELLYEIIKAAELSNEAPFRALFRAYDQVLAKHGIDPGRDQLYFRFLLRMREGSQEGCTLFQQFEALLAKLNIQVDFADEDRPREKDEHDRDVEDVTEPNIDETAGVTGHVSRRASFTSLYEYANAQRPSSREILDSLPARPRSQNVAHNDDATKNPANRTAVRQRTVEHSRRYLKGKPSFAISHQYPGPIFHSRNKSVDDSNASHSSAGVSDSAIDMQSRDQTDVELPYRQGQTSKANTTIEARMEADSKALRFHHRAATAFILFRQWYGKLGCVLLQRREMQELAERKDAQTLKCQALDQWKAAFRGRQRNYETERFFDQLEQKAGKARDMFLLSKAFTHWAQCASDEILRTSAARRHILRTKYFNAWRDISVVNELKVRRMGLSRAFRTWKKHTEQVGSLDNQAITFHNSHLFSTTYNQWFWTFCDRRAPAWYTSRLKSNVFNKWATLTRQSRARNDWAQGYGVLKIMCKPFGLWMQRVGDLQRHTKEAHIFRMQILLLNATQQMQRHVILAPLQSQSIRSTDERLLRRVLKQWYNQAQLYLQAKKISDSRITRNVWTTWNDRLRCNALSKTIDDRIVVQALYNWVLAERLALFLRMSDDKVRKSVFGFWRQRTDDLCDSLGYARHTYRMARNDRFKRLILGKFLSKARHIVDLNDECQSLRERHLAHSTLKTMTEKRDRVRELHKWSKDARFYVLAKSSMHRWHDSCINAKRAKRREAYITFRRGKKMKAARDLLHNWHHTLNGHLHATTQAVDCHKHHIVQVEVVLFDIWRERLLHVNNMTAEGGALRRQHLLGYFHDIAKRYVHSQQAQNKATEFLADVVRTNIGSVLRNLNWRLFQIKRQQETASSLHERNLRRHQRNMIRYWADKTARRRRQLHNMADETDTSVIEAQDRPRLDIYQEATPAYLRTPSRRSAKWKPRVPVSATPATTQLTPFMNRIRAHYTDNAPRTVRGDFARRLAESRLGIEDISETSPDPDD